MENTITQRTIKPYKVTETPLQGRNLIEASAGTGKTFSLAVMAVRLIVEQGMLPKEILMVTFTDMATAELQERVRHFIREAYRYAANGIEPKTEQLKTVVDKCPQQAQYNLTHAIQQLDELNISTIHGFCQRSLSEFAFETGEAFGKELVKDVTPFYEKFILQIYRDKISNLNLFQIQAILNYKVSVNSSWKIIFTKEVLKNFLKDSNGIEFKNFEEYCLKQTQSTNKKLIAKFNAIKQQPEIKLFLDSLHELQKNTCIQDTLEQNYLLDFDRMIENFHHVKLNIINHLQNKYKCLFVDEFQDTDSKQYEIFKTIFHNEHHIVFYIGDPKQAIYGFRGAEINTYLKAKNDIENVYTLNTNFRSAKSLVDTLNKVFDNQNILDKRNPFYFEITGNEIKHLPIQANNDLDISFIYSNNPIEKSFYIQPFEDIQSTAKDIQSLLTYGKNDDQSPILPQQIAFIARSNPDLRVMKQKLALLGIPAVIINEDKIFESEEFSFVRIILNAINSRTQSDLLQFLDYKIFNISFQELHQYDLDIIINQFYTYQLMVNENGIYDTLMQIYRDFNIEQKSLENNDLHLQFWANCNQIAEQLQCIQIQYNFTFKELLHKINRNEIGNEDEYITRVESDEQAVQLLTIHKSKGLEFDYVFTSDLNLDVNIRNYANFFKYYEDETYHYELSLKNIASDNLNFLNSERQEIRRLIYVILTRAKYAVFSYSKDVNNNGKLVNKLYYQLHQNLAKEIKPAFPFLPIEGKYQPTAQIALNPIETTIEVLDKGFRKMSFSALNGHDAQYEPIIDEIIYEEENYEQFALQNLAKGTTTGNLVHQIFEYIDFTKEEQWNKVIDRAIKKYAPKNQELYEAFLPQMIQQVLNATINIENESFQLKNIGNSQKVNELEFDIRSNAINLGALEAIQRENLKFTLKNTSDYYGMLNGLIDLVFEYNGKYYILDWKTNFLGNQTEHYNQKNMNRAMEMNNYHLQYTIYTYALNKYLESRIPEYEYDTHFGGVIYLFVRGIRQNETTGIFTNRITKDELAVINQALA